MDYFKYTYAESPIPVERELLKFLEILYINTDNFMVVGIPYSSWGTPPQPGDEIAALGENGQLVGKTIFKGGFTALTIYGDDQYTTNIVENLSDGETFTFEVWSAQNKTTTGYRFKNWAKGNGSFQSMAVDVVTETPEIPDMEALTLELYPNPGTGEFFLSISANENESVNLAVYDIQGQKLYTQTIDLLKGKQDILLNLTGLEPSIYTLKLFSEKIYEQKQLIIVK